MCGNLGERNLLASVVLIFTRPQNNKNKEKILHLPWQQQLFSDQEEIVDLYFDKGVSF